MTNNKDLTVVEQFKQQLNTPKTETRLVIETEDLYPDLAVKKSKLSPTARQKIVNRNKPYQTQNQENYGPCSAPGCPYSTDFDVDLTIEGNRRKWARRPNDATWLRGTWEYGFWTSHYLSSWNLWLADIDEARKACPLLVNDTVYTVNLYGTHCAEDNKFCNCASEFIRGAIRHHEQGYEVRINEQINSDISKWSRYGFRAGAAIGASFINPGAAIGIGLGAMGAGQAGQAICDSDRGKSFWGTVGNMGGDAVKGVVAGEVVGSIFGTASSSLASQGTKLIGHTAAHEIARNGGAITSRAYTLISTGRIISIGQNAYEIYDALDTWGSPIVDAAKHQIHRLEGTSYRSDCSVCNS